MKSVSRVSLAVVATIAVAHAAHAEDLSRAQAFSWTGLYVGAHLGGGLVDSDVSDPYGSAIYGDNIRSPGPLAGLQVGYDYQTGALVLGLQADVSWADLYGKNTCLQVSPNTFFGATCSSDTDWLGTVTGRVGVVTGPQGRALIYGKGGLAWARGEVNAAVNNVAAGDPGSPDNALSGSATTQLGWTLGVGAEYALGGHWSTNIEYDYLGFGSRDLATPNAAFGPNAPDGRTAGLSQDIQTVKLGLSYRLGGQGGPGLLALPAASVSASGFDVALGGRYVFGWGRFVQNLGRNPAQPEPATVSRLTYDGLTSEGTELFGRIDTPYNVMVKGLVGAGSGNGIMNDEDWVDGLFFGGGPYSNTLQMSDNKISYWTVDVGYDVFRAPDYKLAPFVGYNRFRQSMPTFGCTAIFEGGNTNCYPTPSPADENGITEDDVWQALRLGVAGEFSVLPGVRLSGEAAYLPKVWFDGTDDHGPGHYDAISPESGEGTGVQLETALTYDVTSNFSLGIGGRYWTANVINGVSDFNGSGRLVTTDFSLENASVFGQASLKLP